MMKLTDLKNISPKEKMKPKRREDLPNCLISLRRWNCGVSMISTHNG